MGASSQGAIRPHPAKYGGLFGADDSFDSGKAEIVLATQPS